MFFAELASRNIINKSHPHKKIVKQNKGTGAEDNKRKIC